MESLNYTYEGKSLDTLTHEEFLVAARWAYDTLNAQRQIIVVDREMAKLFAETGAALAQLRRRT